MPYAAVSRCERGNSRSPWGTFVPCGAHLGYHAGVNLSAPSSILLSTADGPILGVLAGTTRPLSGREIARLSGLSANGAWKALRRLVEHGLVSADAAGAGTVVYALNRDHLAADPAIALARLRATLLERLRTSIDAWRPAPLHASLFGSAARGDGDTTSDIDLLIIRPRGVDEDDPEWRAQIESLADDVLRWTGNHAGIADVGEGDIKRLSNDRPPIVDELEQDAILLAGTPVSSLFAQGRS